MVLKLKFFSENLTVAGALNTPRRIPEAIKGSAGKRPEEAKARLIVVRMERLELSRVAPLEPKSSASTNFATFACGMMLDYT